MGFYGFYGSRLVFHGSRRIFMIFHGSKLVFHGTGWIFMFFFGFPWSRVGFSWFFMVPGQLEPPVSNEKVGVTKNEHFLELCQEQASNIFAIYLS